MIGEHPDWQRWTPEERQAFVDREQERWLETLPDLPDPTTALDGVPGECY